MMGLIDRCSDSRSLTCASGGCSRCARSDRPCSSLRGGGRGVCVWGVGGRVEVE
jgi:hypothetical protein